LSALAFDPWAALKRKVEDDTPANVANPANLPLAHPPRLAGLAGLAGEQSPRVKSPSNPATVSLPALVEQMADAMMANPVYQITNPESAMAYFQANALTRLTASRRE
jgi:hypothetical protein